jgi:PAS domain S-box-containing protein
MSIERELEIARSLFRESSDACFVFAPIDQRIVDLNPAALRLTGFGRKAALGMNIKDLFTSTAENGMRRLMEAVDETRFFHSREEYGLARQEGEPLVVNVSVSRIHTKPDPLGLVVVRDVTERRRAHEVLDRFFRHSPALFGILGPDGRFVRVNAAWEQALGYSTEELRALAPSDLAHPDDSAAVRNVVAATQGAEVSPLETRFRHKSGVYRCLSWGTASADGMTYVVALDVTERQRAESFQRAKDAAEAADRAKSAFLANMSHELRTPMSAILGFTDLLIDQQIRQAGPDVTLDYLQTIKRNGDLLVGIVDDILDLSKIEADRIDVELVPCSPTQIVADVIGLMRVRSDEKRLPLGVKYLTPVPTTILTDSVRLRQILFNLMGNAIKFTERGGVELRVRLENEASAKPAMSFVVVDTGIGMSPEEIGDLFQSFYRTTASRKLGFSGSGLGLAISQRLAQKLGGSITAQSAPGEGSWFTLTIPIGPLDDQPRIHPPSESFARAGGSPVSPIGPTKLACGILLAEDNRDNQLAISQLLSIAGADVTVARNGRLAIDLALAARDQGRPFDVILMDMHMPIVDGYEATRQLRALGVKTPIIALTAHAMSTDRAECLQIGCDDFVSKPIDWPDLLQRIVTVETSARNAGNGGENAR